MMMVSPSRAVRHLISETNSMTARKNWMTNQHHRCVSRCKTQPVDSQGRTVSVYQKAAFRAKRSRAKKCKTNLSIWR